MKLSCDRELVSSEMPTTAFGIAKDAVGHIMAILRGQIYSDRQLAVVREYTANAVDAHREAGCPDRPVEIHIPTGLDPVLRIRDYGLGMNPEKIQEVFAMYGASTKRESNLQIGMLGIGSKSAFAYADTFTIQTRCDGLCHTYVSVLNEDDTGVVSLMDTRALGPDEETGTEIQVPVKSQDFRLFELRVLHVVQWLEPQPLLFMNGQTWSRPAFKNPEFSRNNCEVYKNPLKGLGRYAHEFYASLGSTQPYVVTMGGLSYPIDLGLVADRGFEFMLKGESVVLPWTHLMDRNLDIGIRVDVPIGSLDIAASREALQYTEKTKRVIRLALANFLGVIVRDIDQQLEQAKTPWDLQIFWSRFKQSGPVARLVGFMFDKFYKSITNRVIPIPNDTLMSPVHLFSMRGHPTTWTNHYIIRGRRKMLEFLERDPLTKVFYFPDGMKPRDLRLARGEYLLRAPKTLPRALFPSPELDPSNSGLYLGVGSYPERYSESMALDAFRAWCKVSGMDGIPLIPLTHEMVAARTKAEGTRKLKESKTPKEVNEDLTRIGLYRVSTSNELERLAEPLPENTIKVFIHSKTKNFIYSGHAAWRSLVTVWDFKTTYEPASLSEVQVILVIGKKAQARYPATSDDIPQVFMRLAQARLEEILKDPLAQASLLAYWAMGVNDMTWESNFVSLRRGPWIVDFLRKHSVIFKSVEDESTETLIDGARCYWKNVIGSRLNSSSWDGDYLPQVLRPLMDLWQALVKPLKYPCRAMQFLDDKAAKVWAREEAYQTIKPHPIFRVEFLRFFKVTRGWTSRPNRTSRFPRLTTPLALDVHRIQTPPSPGWPVQTAFHLTGLRGSRYAAYLTTPKSTEKKKRRKIIKRDHVIAL